MKFAQFGIYRHRNCLDVDVLVLKVQYRGSKYCKLRIAYFYRNGMALNISEGVTVKKEEYKNWRRVG